jgi:hypothetical protein
MPEDDSLVEKTKVETVFFYFEITNPFYIIYATNTKFRRIKWEKPSLKLINHSFS